MQINLIRYAYFSYYWNDITTNFYQQSWYKGTGQLFFGSVLFHSD